MSDKKLSQEELLSLSVKDLVIKRAELKKQLFQYKMQNQAKALKQTHLIKLTRRNIARINTAITKKIKELSLKNPGYKAQLSK